MDGGIIRVRRSRKWAAVNITGAEDVDLSWEARGVLWYLLVKPDDWQVWFADLLNKGPSGRDKLRRIFRELIAAGYMRRYRVHRGEDGRFVWVTEVYEEPQEATGFSGDGDDDIPDEDEEEGPLPSTGFQAMEEVPSTGLPSTGLPAMGLPATVNPSIYHDPTNHDPTNHDPTHHPRTGGGGLDHSEKSTPTETEHYLLEQGFHPASARAFREYPLPAVRADYERRTAGGSGPGAIVQAWRACPPHLAGPPRKRQPSDTIRFAGHITEEVRTRWLDLCAQHPAHTAQIAAEFLQRYPVPAQMEVA
jgi:hypothetical protein